MAERSELPDNSNSGAQRQPHSTFDVQRSMLDVQVFGFLVFNIRSWTFRVFALFGV